MDGAPRYFLTAYGIAVKHGYQGTEEEWLASLTAYGMAVAMGYEGTETEWLQKLNDPVPELVVGETVTLEAGLPATVEITGPKERPVLNFGIPRGIGQDDVLFITGGEMRGSIEMGGNRITDLPLPEDGNDAANKAYVLYEVGKKASTASYTGTFTAAGWSGSAPYSQAITVPGILGTDEPWVDIDMSKVPAGVDAEEAWNFVGRVTASADNTIVAYCNKEKPEVDLPIILKVVR